MPPFPKGPLRVAVIGCGERGRRAYGAYALAYPKRIRVVACAESDPDKRDRFATEHGLEPDDVHVDWRSLFTSPRPSFEAIIVATPDREHVEPAVAALEHGRDVLLEKPIAPTLEGVLAVRDAARRSSGSVTVSHVLRYTPFFSTLHRLVDEGAVGNLIGIDHAENIGYWHFAHSYVRGNWRNEATASPMLLAKACHDLDLLRWFAGAPCVRVHSAGGLRHFRAENVPSGAPARCIDGCPHAETCPFYAPRFYIERLALTDGPPVSAISFDTSPAGRERALREGLYGRCVYRCDNDVADHQVATLEFANGVTASLTVSAFTPDNTRTIKLMGTRGELRGRLDTGEIELRRFLPAPGAPISEDWGRDAAGRAALAGDQVELVTATPIDDPLGADVASGSFVGHDGGDEGLISAFVAHALARRRGESRPAALTTLEEAAESHLMAFAAERSRREGTTVSLP
ncbi:MAG: Gfo/Idh/MocA family oxidoreductase [Chloroflexota bacterium]